jgi:hypothetical protein
MLGGAISYYVNPPKDNPNQDWVSEAVYHGGIRAKDVEDCFGQL